MAYFSGASHIEWDAVFKTTDLNANVRKHLTNTYFALTATLATGAVGVIAGMSFYLPHTLAVVGAFVAILAIHMISEKHMMERLAILLGFGFLEGVCLAPLISMVINIDPKILTTAFLGTSTIFVCFSLSAIFAKRRSMLYLGGFLGSCVSVLLVAGLLNMFMRSYFLFNVQLYLGLVVFCLYVIFDTQLIIEKAFAGKRDFVGDSLQLFIDFVAVFIRLLIILSKLSKEKK
eukprot:TRINITY_DN1080_c0_g1_i2.p1 TRINITY_DN1080_c0_g1~~TRINITY_DN1080_c0_g1_i2.p1  ORF type:complete len:232 (+),score=50.76 TRINITY_DN1080_c0_g1_i2:170-865(+)